MKLIKELNFFKDVISAMEKKTVKEDEIISLGEEKLSGAKCE